MTTKQPLTLERLAALDEAASPGPYCSVHFEDTSWVCATDPPLTGDQDSDTAEFRSSARIAACDNEPERGANASFLAASKGAAPRLLAALRGLADSWEIGRDRNGEMEQVQSREADELRALIETLDLSQPPAPQEESA